MGREIITATVEGLVLLKLYALPSLYRQGSFTQVGIYENDVATLWNEYAVDVEQLVGELEAYLGERDMMAVREIVSEIQQRIVRFQRAQEDTEGAR